MSVTSEELELLETYLDRELDEPSTREAEGRIQGEPRLAGLMAELAEARSMRVRALSLSFDGDAGAADRLIAALRAAHASELIRETRVREASSPLARLSDNELRIANEDESAHEPALQEQATQEQSGSESAAEPVRTKPNRLSASVRATPPWTKRARWGFYGAAAACLAIGTYIGVSIDHRGGEAGPVAGMAKSGIIESGSPASVEIAPQVQFVLRVTTADGREVWNCRLYTRESADSCARALYTRLTELGQANQFRLRVTEEPF